MRQTNLVINDKIKKEFKIKEKEGILRGISPKILGSSPARGTTNKPETKSHLNYYLIKILPGNNQII